jgi:nitrogen fixation/metabolism regulation signal transduction histidine kinase
VNRDLARFFEVGRDQDTVRHFDLTKSDPAFRDLHKRMNEVIFILANLRSEKEEDYRFFRAVFDHAGTGLIVHDENHDIVLINKAATQLLGTKKFSDIKGFLPENTKPGAKATVRLEQNGNEVQLSVRNRKIWIGDRTLTLLSLQNIRQELEQNEVESWQKLIRVFIHEIMNSVSPVTLTASGIINILEKNESLTDTQKKEILDGLHAIRKRSKGIAAFMESYRSLSKTPAPDFSYVPAAKMMDQVGKLMQNDFQKRNIRFSVFISPKDLKILCDEKLVEHVLINLIKNAVEALVRVNSPEIRLSCVSMHDRIQVTVQDNGPGIDSEITENIFVPFFTTKPEGTGIGLSLSRQIMNLHGGSIFVNSEPGETIFTISFPM